MPSLLRGALVRAQDFLIDPASERRRDVSQVEVVVLGLSAGCGVTTLARGLAISLELPGERQSHLLAIGGDADRLARSERAGLGPTSWHVPTNLRDPTAVADHGRTVAQLASGPSALVWDVASSEVDRARVAAQRADAALLVAGAGNEPALAELVARMLGEGLGRVMLVANRVREESRWSGRPGVCIPESRLGAALLARGYRPAGAFGAAFARLTALVEAGA